MTTLRLYNTLTRTKEDFVPLDPANVRMYVCGPTVYDYAHIGNARPAIVFDVLFRLLRHLYGENHVTYVRNITDVDDKINARAAERGISIRDLTDETYQYYRDDMAALGCLPPTYEPRATEHLDEMRDIIERLVAEGHAYVANEHVLFHVPSMPDYGQLSRRSLDEMIAGARVDPAPYKKNPMDFVLWKPSIMRESNLPIPGWKSPAKVETPGRPGWHIECSAMAWKYLKETFDIHGGGIDLVFPHHENEIAQSRCAFHTSLMARYWMHNGHLQVEGAKMSKSLGNFVTVHDLLKDWPGEVLRLNMLRSHYRQPMDWTVAGLEESKRILDEWIEALRDDDGDLLNDFDPKPSAEVTDALMNDLNTPGVITEMHVLAGEAAFSGGDARRQFGQNLAFLGLDRYIAVHEHEMHARLDRAVDLQDRVQAQIDARNAARKAKNFKEADRIRDELKAEKIVLYDNKDGTTTWGFER